MDRVGAAKSTGVSTYHLSVSSCFVGASTADVLPLVANMVKAPRLEPDALAPAASLALQEIESLADDPQRRAVLAASVETRGLPSAPALSNEPRARS